MGENVLFVPHCDRHVRSMRDCEECNQVLADWKRRHEESAAAQREKRERWNREDLA